MENNYRADETFKDMDFTSDPLSVGEYEACEFKNCNLSGCNLTDIKFIDCVFTETDLSLAKLNYTSLRDAVFTNCKMLGLRFDNCNEFGLSFRFTGCNLNDSSFYKTILKKTRFKDSTLHNADFTEADLSQSVFDKCDLKGAVFSNTNLDKCDFETAFNYSINPETNKIKKAKFSIPSVIGLLDKYDIKINLK